MKRAPVKRNEFSRRQIIGDFKRQKNRTTRRRICFFFLWLWGSFQLWWFQPFGNQLIHCCPIDGFNYVERRHQVPPLRQGLAPRRLMFFCSEEETFRPIGSVQLATIWEFLQNVFICHHFNCFKKKLKTFRRLWIKFRKLIIVKTENLAAILLSEISAIFVFVERQLDLLRFFGIKSR